MRHPLAAFRLVPILGILMFLAAASAVEVAMAEEQKPAGKMLVFVGTYTSGEDEGVYTCELDAATGA